MEPGDADPDPVTGTLCVAGGCGASFPDFYRLAAAAAQSAQGDMSRAQKIDDFKTHARE